MAFIRFLHLTHELREILHVSHLLHEKSQPHSLYFSVVPLPAYRQHNQTTRLGIFEWRRIHQGRTFRLRSLSICNQNQIVRFYDEEENIIFSLTQVPAFLHRKEPILIENEERTGFLEIITKEHRLLLSFTLSQWPSLVFPIKNIE
ncbi:hypothetical protein [Aneurinibacillus sp. UBA3580]|jgi:hypothetical protein|uniref:hypothetical protein n=1 Tax=Aneurinibacillus sp. UBA3580 TaxID=1946041 RepID=UPI00257F4A32|nr:hypothetical protein [Aneurinibacillus sp. UBA3580]